MIPRFMLLILSAGFCLSGCDGADTGCQTDQDCPSGKYCRTATGQCELDCVNDTDCPSDFTCDPRGRCQEGCRTTNNGIESCDGVDNDCDGDTDEDLGLEDCSADNLHGSCPGSAHCQLGNWICDAPLPGAEDCDGVDNDCDDTTDEDLDSPGCPMQLGICAGSFRACLGLQGWSPTCDYGAGFEAVEQSCDDLDNDCDGATDEDLTRDSCVVTNQYGQCPGIEICSHGEWICDGPQAAPEECDQVDSDCDGVTDNGAPQLDLCELGTIASDGLDNNCDGRFDETGGCSLRVQVGTVDVFMDMYEATVVENSDCTGTTYGQMVDDYPAGWPPDPRDALVTLYACSLPGIIPSGSVSYYQAERACVAQGRRLCTLEEWKAACQGDPPQTYPYGDSYQPDTCNSVASGLDESVEAGSYEGCLSPTGLYDMSGNLWEWVSDECSWEAGRFSIQSGSYECEYSDGVNCDHTNPDHAEDIASNYSCSYSEASHWCAYPYTHMGMEQFDHGFRCCSDP